MDDRRAHLVAAAEAARVWVHAQRATWADGIAVDLPALPTAVVVPSGPGAADPGVVSHHVSPVAPSSIFTSYSASDADVSADAHEPMVVHSLADRTYQVLGAVASAVVPGARRFWRVALAAVVVLACTGMARTYGPEWAAALKSRLSAVGARTTAFQRQNGSENSGPAAAPLPLPAAKPAASIRLTGRLQVDSNPPGAQVVINGEDRGVTPLTVANLKVGGHVVILRGAAGEVRRTASISAGKTTRLSEDIFAGWLHVSSPIELQVFEGTDGVPLDDRNHVLLPSGPHEMRFENRALRFAEVRKFEVKPGATTAISIVPPTSTLSVMASTPAEVLLDGTLVGGTPLRDHAVTLGTHELTVRNAEGIVRTSMLTITVDPVRLEIDFSRP